MGYLLLAYLVGGLLFGGWFFINGHVRLDPSSQNAAWHTRLLWVPGAILLWPFLVKKTIRSARGGAA
ncbi:MAG: hypothetical protein AAF529_09480 [Pseudomonadota bacterium]